MAAKRDRYHPIGGFLLAVTSTSIVHQRAEEEHANCKELPYPPVVRSPLSLPQHWHTSLPNRPQMRSECLSMASDLLLTERFGRDGWSSGNSAGGGLVEPVSTQAFPRAALRDLGLALRPSRGRGRGPRGDWLGLRVGVWYARATAGLPRAMGGQNACVHCIRSGEDGQRILAPTVTLYPSEGIPGWPARGLCVGCHRRRRGSVPRPARPGRPRGRPGRGAGCGRGRTCRR